MTLKGPDYYEDVLLISIQAAFICLHLCMSVPVMLSHCYLLSNIINICSCHPVESKGLPWQCRSHKSVFKAELFVILVQEKKLEQMKGLYRESIAICSWTLCKTRQVSYTVNQSKNRNNEIFKCRTICDKAAGSITKWHGLRRERYATNSS